MATTSFIMEDQTDEDFFDKLVDDEFVIGDSSAVSLLGVADLGDLDEDQHVVACCASLSLNESGNLTQVQPENFVVKSLDSLGNTKLDELEQEKESQKVAEVISDAPLEGKAFAELTKGIAGGINSNDSQLEFPFGKGHQRAQTSVKEVQWSAFHTEETENDLGLFGSYSDFFTGFCSDVALQTEEKSGGKFCSLPSQPQSIFPNRQTHELVATGTALDGSPRVAYGSSLIPDSEKDLVDRSIIPDPCNAVVESSNGWATNYLEAQAYGGEASQPNEQLEYSSQYWENMYPGWWYDHNTGEWHQRGSSDAISSSTYTDHVQTNFQISLENAVANDATNNVISDQGIEISSLQKTSTSVVQAVSEECTAGFISNWNGAPQDGNGVYPSNMYFHPDHPEWYYDTNTQEWHQLDEQFNQFSPSVGSEFGKGYIQQAQNNYYTEIVGSNFEGGYGQHAESDGVSGCLFVDKTPPILSTQISQIEDHKMQDKENECVQSMSHYSRNIQVPNSPKEPIVCPNGFNNLSSHHQSNGYVLSHGNMYQPAGDMKYYTHQQISNKTTEMVSSYRQENLNFISGIVQTPVPNPSVPQKMFGFDQQNITQDNLSYYSPNYFENHQPPSYFQTDHLSDPFASNGATGMRDSAGHPPHALVTFGFGGKLVLMKLNAPFNENSALEKQDPAGGVISVHNLMDVVADKSGLGSYGISDLDYFKDLCHSSFPGPLVGGTASNKDVHKWIDERVASHESYKVNYRKGESLRVLLSLLKISCLHYGKLRSPFGAEATLQDNDGPESAVTKLFASARQNDTQLTEHSACAQCLQSVPSEGSIRSTAIEVQKLLVAGRRLEALQRAQGGQLWGPALVLASKLGEKYYVETVKQMAHRQFIYGSPMRTLCLLISGQLADVFSSESTTSPRQLGTVISSSQLRPQASDRGMLDDWQENLSIVVANRTKDDELVIIHLGDCLWKETGEVTAAHACYLLAEANFDTFSDSARLCLLGADHWKSPRTFASPDAIQRTELYEYAKVLGNSQFILQAFQPYKLVYAHMLAEVGKVSESLRYCQAILKLLKNVGRTADSESWKTLTLSLEERLRSHQQGGYSSNLAPGKLVGKVLTRIDRSIHRIIGGSPPLPPHQSHGQTSETNDHPKVATISNGPSRGATTTLMPSASMEPISEWAGGNNRMAVPSRSISEPDFGRTEKQNAQTSASETQGKAATSGGSSRMGFLRTNIMEKVAHLVSGARRAKLGEKNKFYYDEKLKRWVEEGADPQAEAAELAPPPTTASFQTNLSSQNVISIVKRQGTFADSIPEIKSPPPLEHSAGIPPMPPSSNQFSARGRLGVRSRYVDTFNKSGTVAPTNTFQAPTLPAAKHGGATAQFFIPTPSVQAPDGFNPTSSAVDSDYPVGAADNEASVSATPSPSPSVPSVPSSLHRYPSMDNITPMSRGSGGLSTGSAMFSSRQRAASWSGSCTEAFGDGSKSGEGRRQSEALSSPSYPLASPPGRFMPVSKSMSMSPTNANIADELQEVEL